MSTFENQKPTEQIKASPPGAEAGHAPPVAGEFESPPPFEQQFQPNTPGNSRSAVKILGGAFVGGAVLAGAALFTFGGSGGESTNDADADPTAEAPATTASPEDYTEGVVAPGAYDAESFAGRLCSELYVDQEPVYITEGKTCLSEDGEVESIVTDVYFCEDGPNLWSDEFGWGYLGEESHRKDPGETLSLDEANDCISGELRAAPRR